MTQEQATGGPILMLLDAASLYFRAFYGVKQPLLRPRRHAHQRRPRVPRHDVDAAQPVPRDRHGGLHRHRLAPGLAGGAGPLLQDPPPGRPQRLGVRPWTPALVGGAQAGEAEPLLAEQVPMILEALAALASPPSAPPSTRPTT